MIFMLLLSVTSFKIIFEFSAEVYSDYGKEVGNAVLTISVSCFLIFQVMILTFYILS